MSKFLARLWKQTIWSSGAIPPEEWRYRSQKRFWYPLVDVLLALTGASAIRFGIPAINEFFTDEQVDFFGTSMIVWSLVALVGVVFYRLWWVEVIGKCLLIGHMTVYVTAVLTLTAFGDEARGFVIGIAMVATCVLMMRLSIVAAEWQERRTMQHSVSDNQDPWSRAGQREIRDSRESPDADD